MQFYKDHQKENPSANLTQVADLTAAMLGTSEHKLLKTKAAETFGILVFLQSQLRKRAEQLGPKGAVRHEAGQCLVRFVELIKESGPIMSSKALQDG
eukprot:5976719-Alexandrium_andersonii.AAC.1